MCRPARKACRIRRSASCLRIDPVSAQVGWNLLNVRQSGCPVWEFSFLELEGVLEELFTLQGKSERIKNFPYPRHFATLNHYFMWIFILLLPLAIVPQFAEIGKEMIDTQPIIGSLFIWFTIPFYVLT